MQKQILFPGLVERSNFLAVKVFDAAAFPEEISGAAQIFFGRNAAGAITIFCRNGETLTDLLAGIGDSGGGDSGDGVTLDQVNRQILILGGE